ncbi:cbb3-type cytochrome c oxidase subunit I [Hymenobacter sp. H14-R3]|uniref:cbb3-type cytochrome c oxidase subunit I n=1 Tax=Hymenobacter sp. H14-R3 TaxID=3046308 RepID=UPI0024B9444F|nr:cbb3-type cytochrome c oxidase subunit I [Hymenobacter sp. H14-R3]MDJ0367713.1 cbb3-type cytochrome c oxidase subunit I [Hymenobacter sp. H14-R3]
MERKRLYWLGQLLGLAVLLGSPVRGLAQAPAAAPVEGPMLTQPAVLGMLALLLVIVVGGVLVLVSRVAALVRGSQAPSHEVVGGRFDETVTNLTPAQLAAIVARQQAQEFHLSGTELGGAAPVRDAHGVVQHVDLEVHAPWFHEKRRVAPFADLDPRLTQLVAAYLLCAAFWLVLGTAVGWYVGVKFVRPDVDHLAALSFGRLRPVHTNMVFWGWSSLAMLGLGHFVVPRTNNVPLYSLRWGWWALGLINASVLLGSLCLMNGLNNGGGEYREYIWPVMLLFAVGVGLSFGNFYQTVARRTTEEFYISNWYILGATVWGIVLTVIGYLPWYQNGMGETIIQGYYMHMGVGMWFMTFTLGLMYYFLPMSLNKPIYSYSLGVLAFWTQLLFYTMIGTHHFIFSPLPWWLQTVAIVFSVGMVIPVLAGTINFLMTFRGGRKRVGDSYSLPFLLMGVLFYFTGSFQGSLQALRYTNLVWHFTDFNVAHSHITMYGIIAFMLWGCIYTLAPRLRGREPRQGLVGVHFWCALLGLLAYAGALMVGGTLKGQSWLAGEPFIQSVVLMAPYWLWRAIGGTLMLLAHVVFFYNLVDMLLLGQAPAPVAEPTPAFAPQADEILESV